jgi:tripartite-type tricarboxylate transporter receptor subunit TctC
MCASRKLFSVLIALAVLALNSPAHSQEWPQRTVKIVFPYAPGTAVDGIARLLAQRFSKVFGQPFIIENRVGANGIIAADAAAHSLADGYTLFWATTPQIAIAPHMMKVSYDPVKDFVPISAVMTNTFVLIANPKMPVKTLAEFIDYVRARPAQLTYAEAGLGSIGHLSMVLLLNRAKLEMTNVTYKGNAPALTDVIAGHVPVMFSLLSDARSQASNGSVRLIAVSSEKRTPQAPDVPTVSESGFPGFNTGSWHGLMAPSGTPKAIIDRIAAEVARAAQDPEFAARMTTLGVDPLGNSPQEFAKMISADIELWREAIKIADIKIQ